MADEQVQGELELEEPQTVEPEVKPDPEPAPEPSPEEKAEAEAKKEKTAVQKRIDELTRARRDAERRADQAMRLLEQERTRETRPAAPQPKPDAVPKRDDFETYEDYIEAKATHSARKMINEELRKVEHTMSQDIEKERQQAEEQEVHSRLEIIKTKGREKYQDFDAVALAENLPITRAMAEAIAESDVADEVSYYLGKNPEEAERISKMRPLSAARAIGLLETTLKTKPSQTKAPSPARPTSGGGSQSTRDLAKLSMDEYIAVRRKQGADF